jgi:hypothetical protein
MAAVDDALSALHSLPALVQIGQTRRWPNATEVMCTLECEEQGACKVPDVLDSDQFVNMVHARSNRNGKTYCSQTLFINKPNERVVLRMGCVNTELIFVRARTVEPSNRIQLTL